MTPAEAVILAAVIGAFVTVAFGLLKVSRQAGRIEEGVRGLYSRLDRVERWIDRRR